MSRRSKRKQVRTIAVHNPATGACRIRALIIDSILYLVSGLGLLWIVVSTGLLAIAPYLIPSASSRSFISISATDTDPPFYYVGISTLAIPDSDFWAAIFLSYWPIVFLVPVFLYEVPLIALQGQTVGKMLTNLKIVRSGDENLPRWGRSCVRWAVRYLPLFVPFGIVFTLLVTLSPLFDPDRRGWHDKIAGTMVVRISEEIDNQNQQSRAVTGQDNRPARTTRPVQHRSTG